MICYSSSTKYKTYCISKEVVQYETHMEKNLRHTPITLEEIADKEDTIELRSTAATRKRKGEKEEEEGRERKRLK